MADDSPGRVIIVGAGPVGLGAALELARCGVRSVLIERHDATSWHPKTPNFNRTATGEQFGVIESKGFEGPGPDVSPAWPVMSSQELIEAILLDAARATGMVDVRFASAREDPAMKKPFARVLAVTAALSLVVALALLGAAPARGQTDPLPAWADGPAKKAIVDFVAKVTKTGGADFVPVDERIATFDNDGTLWAEQPLYFQLAFALDRVKVLAPQHPEWKTTEPFASLLKDDLKGALADGERAILEIVMATHAGMTTQEFEQIVKDWVAKARHPKTKRLYTEMVYQAMLEVLAYLRANGFKTYIVSGGGIEFMRPWTEKVYGIPPEQVIGSTIKTQFDLRDGQPVLIRLPEVDFIDDKVGKPVAINKFIGRRPILAFGNSDGDLQMLQWTAAGKGARLMLIVHHTDAEREWAYDRKSHIGTLDKALDEATAKGWTVVDMKKEWKAIFPQ